MGYDGYSSMKEDFIRALAEGMEIHSEDIKVSDDMKTILKKVYQSNVQMLSDTLVLADDENYEKALDALLKARDTFLRCWRCLCSMSASIHEIWKTWDSVFRT